MNIIKVLGVVVAVHVVAYIVIAQPGCRSTASQPTPARPVAAEPVAPAPGFDDALNPAATGPSPIAVNFPMAEVTPVAGDRYAPTRPGATPAPSPVETTPAKSYTVQKGDSFYLIARKNGITVNELIAANNLTKQSIIRPGQKLVVPAKAVATATAGSTKSLETLPEVGGATYTVKSGDTLSKIASRHRTTTKTLRALNNISGDYLRIGQTLQLPGSATAVASSRTLPPPPAADPVATSRAAAGPSTPGMHTVSAGETADSISRRYQISVGELLRANQITDPRKIRIGQVLTIPGAAGAQAAPPPPSFVPDATPATVVEPPSIEELPADVMNVEPAATPIEEDAPVVPVDEAPPAVPAPRID